MTPLHKAVQYARIEIVKFLVEERVDINSQDSKGVNNYLLLKEVLATNFYIHIMLLALSVLSLLCNECIIRKHTDCTCLS